MHAGRNSRVRRRFCLTSCASQFSFLYPARNAAGIGDRGSSVRLAAVLHAGNLDGVVVLEIEESPIIAAAEAKTGPRRLELFHVTGAVGQVPVNAVQNLQRSLPL